MGVVGRASGIDRDLRRDRPFAAYDVLQPKVALYRYGDVRQGCGCVWMRSMNPSV